MGNFDNVFDDVFWKRDVECGVLEGEDAFCIEDGFGGVDFAAGRTKDDFFFFCLLYTSPSPRDRG